MLERTCNWTNFLTSFDFKLIVFLIYLGIKQELIESNRLFDDKSKWHIQASELCLKKKAAGLRVSELISFTKCQVINYETDYSVRNLTTKRKNLKKTLLNIFKWWSWALCKIGIICILVIWTNDYYLFDTSFPGMSNDILIYGWKDNNSMIWC